MKKGSILPLLEGFFTDYLPSSKGVSTNTLEAYQYAFRLLFTYFSDEKCIQPDKVTFELLGGGAVDSFLAYLEEQRHCTVKTRNLRRAALMAFAKYAADKDFTASMPFYTAMVKTPKKKETEKRFHQIFYQRGSVYHPFCAKYQYIDRTEGYNPAERTLCNRCQGAGTL